jgi:non-ribosomal peptide synthetase component F
VARRGGIPGSDVEIHNVGLNPTRIALLDVLRQGGAVVDQYVDREPAASRLDACVFGTGRLVR